MAKKKPAIDFEKGLAALEKLVETLEGEMPLEDALRAYEEGVRLHAALAALLDESEKRLKTLACAEADA
ncbi:MAG: exodeoxyribonuclease VII small subunit [Firmicutes bacterium]|nr:exodeoxyribonuclease VII small subunit [Bacillota bacterium]